MNPTKHGPSRLSLARTASFAFAFGLGLVGGCSSVVLEQDPNYAFGDVTTFAWRAAPRYAAGAATGELDHLRTLENRIERQLDARGIRLVPKKRAHIVVSATLAVETGTESTDRTYATYASEQFEEGILTVQVFDRAKRKLIWAGEGRERLRVKARSFGQLVARYEPTNEPRVWPIEKMVDRVLARIPR
ncbi:MAG: DUF4136 domain-containing protein [Planctomycetota bacterium]